MIKINKNIFLTVCTIALITLAFQCQAQSIVFYDSSTDNSHWNFPEYEWTNGYIEDEVGTPKIDSMEITWDENSGLLQSVKILLTNTEIQNFDSLFINTNYTPNTDGSLNLADWDSWDYFVHSGGYTNVGNTDGSVPGDGLYSVSDDYDYTTNSSGGRTDHPNGIDSSDLTYLTDLTRTHAYNSYEIVYDFTSLADEFKIYLGDSFSFAYSPWCANDLVWGTYNGGGDPVPEPATMLLFGSGLVGLAAVRRKKK